MKKRTYSKGEKRKIIIEYIKNNPGTTYREIKENTKLNVTREFKKGMSEAFKEAGIRFPRNFKIKTKEERRKIIINYIIKHPEAGGHTIAKETKINVSNAFKNIEEAYKFAGIKYPREIDKRKKEEKKKKIIQLIKGNPSLTIAEITKISRCQPYKLFKNSKDIYQQAGINHFKGHEKWNLKKKREVIDFIKLNPLATQREINKSCRTKVQSLFERGIFEAYEKAKIKFPFERLKLYGVGLKEVRDRARIFEEEIAIKLSGYGSVNRLIKTKRGIADIILERKNKKIIIEIKDYLCKDISISQIKQLNKYLEDQGCNLGVLVCHKKPKKDKFLIGKNKIYVLEKENLGEIIKFFDKG